MSEQITIHHRFHGPPHSGHGRIPGHKDKARDDDVDILIKASGEVIVEYRN